MKCMAHDRTYKQAKADNLATTVRFYAILFAYVLADKYSFGGTKLRQILTSVTKLAEEIKDDEIKLTELADVLDEEYNIHIK